MTPVATIMLIYKNINLHLQSAVYNFGIRFSTKPEHRIKRLYSIFPIYFFVQNQSFADFTMITGTPCIKYINSRILLRLTCLYVSSIVGIQDSRKVPFTKRSTRELLPTPPAPNTTTRQSLLCSGILTSAVPMMLTPASRGPSVIPFKSVCRTRRTKAKLTHTPTAFCVKAAATLRHPRISPSLFLRLCRLLFTLTNICTLFIRLPRVR